MTFSRLGRASGLTVAGVLTAALLAGCAPAPDALAGAATAGLARTTTRTCAGDAAMKPKSSSTIGYSSLTGSDFASRQRDADGKILRLAKQSLRFRDFKPAEGTIDGGVLGAGGLVGAGASKSKVELVPHSSTHKRDVPHVSSRTNQLDILRVTGTAKLLRGFEVRATPQGHLYNGLRIDRIHGLRASHIRVVGVAGDEHQQPGETFGINDYRTVGSRWSHIVVDGKGVGASGFGVNGSKDITICGSTSRNNAVAMGFAFWQSSGIRLVDDTAIDNGFAGFNFERTTGKVVMIRPVAHGNRYNMRIASDRSSAKFTIIDPKLVNGVWTIWMPKRWFTTNKQKRSDVTLIIHGKKRPDLLRFVSY